MMYCLKPSLSLSMFCKSLQEPERERPTSPPPLPPPPVPQQGLQIRKDYNPKVARPPAPPSQPPQHFLISPITGEKIPAEKMQEHMRYGELQELYMQFFGGSGHGGGGGLITLYHPPPIIKNLGPACANSQLSISLSHVIIT